MTEDFVRASSAFPALLEPRESGLVSLEVTHAHSPRQAWSD